MSAQNNHQDDFIHRMWTDISKIDNRLRQDILSLDIWSKEMESSLHSLVPTPIPSFSDHPISRLGGYIKSLDTVCKQAIYAMECLHLYAAHISVSPDFYVEYYLYDFIGRVKSGIDLVALIINHIFEIGQGEKNCSLEKGHLKGELERYNKGNDTTNKTAKELAKYIQSMQNKWVKPFYEFRNLVIHRHGLKFVLAANPEGARLHIVASGLLEVTNDRKTLNTLFSQIKMPAYSSGNVDPSFLCEGIWKNLAELVEYILKTCSSEIRSFISVNRHPDSP